jgi:CTP synthase (UTP-ammonia lyase)
MFVVHLCGKYNELSDFYLSFNDSLSAETVRTNAHFINLLVAISRIKTGWQTDVLLTPE